MKMKGVLPKEETRKKDINQDLVTKITEDQDQEVLEAKVKRIKEQNQDQESVQNLQMLRSLPKGETRKKDINQDLVTKITEDQDQEVLEAKVKRIKEQNQDQESVQNLQMRRSLPKEETRKKDMNQDLFTNIPEDQEVQQRKIKAIKEKNQDQESVQNLQMLRNWSINQDHQRGSPIQHFL